ncbi:WD domain G-beta repeat [Carpediemonas membranifera]|uniref:WD domain G-beta repeat n=1 Tax=Carpediemonas membranifera TaxID=201153 RepID=A0A8J6AUV6_9EUKA|nr:WD domain G-beta repeat [Carpediemonas membranifera]|eukprot:KAG9393080.1 WD domain G-beta repeat [Carpediemonas membranifera]
MDNSTKRHILKSDANRDAVTCGETTNTVRGYSTLFTGPLPFVQPVLTGVRQWGSSIFSSDPLDFNESILINDTVANLVRPGVTIIIELLELRTKTTPPLYPIAWAYIKIETLSDARAALKGEPLELQLHRPPGITEVGNPAPGLGTKVLLGAWGFMTAPAVPPIAPVIESHAPELISKQPERVDMAVTRMMNDVGGNHHFPRSSPIRGCYITVTLKGTTPPAPRVVYVRPILPTDQEQPEPIMTARARARRQSFSQEAVEVKEPKPKTSHERRVDLVGALGHALEKVVVDRSMTQCNCLPLDTRPFSIGYDARCGVWSPSGLFFALALAKQGSADQHVIRVFLVDSTDPEEVKLSPYAEFGTHVGLIHGLAFSADSTFIASAGADGRAQVWHLAGLHDPAPGRQLTVDRVHEFQSTVGLRASVDALPDFRYAVDFVPGMDKILVHGGSSGIIAVGRVTRARTGLIPLGSYQCASGVACLKVVPTDQPEIFAVFIGMLGDCMTILKMSMLETGIEFSIASRLTIVSDVLAFEFPTSPSVTVTDAGFHFMGAVIVRTRNDEIKMVDLEQRQVNRPAFNPVLKTNVIEGGHVASRMAVSGDALWAGSIRGRLFVFDLAQKTRLSPVRILDLSPSSRVSFVASHPTLPLMIVGAHTVEASITPQPTEEQKRVWNSWESDAPPMTVSVFNDLCLVKIGDMAAVDPNLASTAAAAFMEGRTRRRRRRHADRLESIGATPALSASIPVPPTMERTAPLGDTMRAEDPQPEDQKPEAPQPAVDLDASDEEPLDAGVKKSPALAPIGDLGVLSLRQLAPLGQTPARGGGMYLPGLSTPAPVMLGTIKEDKG